MNSTFCGKQIADDELANLVAAARIGDQDAVSALYEKTYSKVYYTVKSMIKDEDAVFDIVQDTYIKAFSRLDGFQGDTKFLPWVRQIAANTARDWLKKRRPMLFAELGSGGDTDTPVEELFPDERIENLPEQVIDQKETTRLLREILDELPEDQRAAIGMFYYEELSVKEIADAMSVSESAVKSRLMYGRRKIEKKVRELEKQGTKLYSLSPLPEGVWGRGAGQPDPSGSPVLEAHGRRSGRDCTGRWYNWSGGRHRSSRYSRCGWRSWYAEDRTYRFCRRGSCRPRRFWRGPDGLPFF